MVSTLPPSLNGRRTPPGVDRAVERALREEVREEISRLLGERQLLAPGAEDAARIRALVEDRVDGYQRRAVATNQPILVDPAGVARRIFDALLRLGPLQPLMDDPAVEEVIANGPGRVFCIRDGRKELVPDLCFDDDEELRQLVKRLIGPLGRRLDESSPMVDARLPDGSRLNAAIPPATTRWTCLTVRKFVLRANSLEQLVELGTLPAPAAHFLDSAVQAGVNILVSGPTGSGKCVTGDTLVTLGDGRLVPIAEVVEEALTAGAPTVGDDGWVSAPVTAQVLTCDFDAGKVFPVEGITAWRHSAPDELIEVRTRSGQLVRATTEHPFFTVVDGKIVQVRADQLRPGDRVAVANELPVGGELPDILDLVADRSGLYAVGAGDLVRRAIDRMRSREGVATLDGVARLLGVARQRMRFWRDVNAVPIPSLLGLLRRAGMKTDELGPRLTLKSRTGNRTVDVPREPPVGLTRLAGLVVGDGHLTRTCVELTSGDEAVRQAFADLCRGLFGVEPVYRPGGERCPTLVLGSSAATELLSAAYGIPRGAKARLVRAPRWLFAAPREHIAAFLSGLLDTDGTVGRTGSGGAGHVEFCTTSRGLAEDIVALLLRLGIRSHLRRRPCCDTVSVYERMALRRLARVLGLAHPARRDTLAAFRQGSGYSGVDVIPGLATPLREARLAAGLSYAETARIFGVSDWLPAMYERGERHPSRARVLDLAGRAVDQGLAGGLRRLASQPVYWDLVAAVRRLRDHGERYVYDLTVPGTHTFLVGSGGVVAHNTTMLNALGSAIASMDERIVTVEETAELQLEKQLPDCVALQGRAGNVEGVGEIRIRDLVRNALRMRPTRIVVGEVRGAEALDMLLAMNTGHDGSLTTVHGNSPRDALDRLATLAAMAEEHVAAEAVTKMVSRTIEVVVQLRFEPRSGRRRVVSIFEVTGTEGGVVAGNDLWALDPTGERLVWTGIQPRCMAKMRARGVAYAPPPAAEAT